MERLQRPFKDVFANLVVGLYKAGELALDEQDQV